MTSSALRVLAVCAVVASTACHPDVVDAPPLTRAVAGTYDGLVAGWQITWSIQQDSTQITGVGSFTLPDGSTAPFTVRGTMSDDVLNVRLVGAPGDSNADSVTYSGRFNTELYVGIEFDGALVGPAPSPEGELSMYLRGTPQARERQR